MIPFNYRHAPIIDLNRKRCPVCNQPVYSLAGIHPQCAVKRADDLESRSRKEAASKAGSTIAVVARGTDTAPANFGSRK